MKLNLILIPILILSAFTVAIGDTITSETFTGQLTDVERHAEFTVTLPANYAVRFKCTWEKDQDIDIDISVDYDYDNFLTSSDTIDGCEKYAFLTEYAGDYVFDVYTYEYISAPIDFTLLVEWDDHPCEIGRNIWSSAIYKGSEFEWKIVEFDEAFSYDFPIKKGDILKVKILSELPPFFITGDTFWNGDYYVNNEKTNSSIDIGLYVIPISINGIYDNLDELSEMMNEEIYGYTISCSWNNDGVLSEFRIQSGSGILFLLTLLDSEENDGFIGISFEYSFLIVIISLFSLVYIHRRK